MRTIKTLDAKWLDPECHDGCISLKLKSQLAALKLENEKLVEALKMAVNTVECASLCPITGKELPWHVAAISALRAEIERVKGGK